MREQMMFMDKGATSQDRTRESVSAI